MLEEHLSLFVKSIFVENLALGVLPGDVHVSGGLEERQHGVRAGAGRDRDSGDYGAGEQSDLPVSVGARSSLVAG